VVEPVLGEGGFVAPPAEFFSIIADICKRHEILFIADEVQSGFGRTGAMFACERYGITPDILVSAKSIADGMPLAAVTGRAEIMDAPGLGALGGTYGGNPLSIAAGHAVLDVIEAEDLCARAARIGVHMRTHLEALAKEVPSIGDVRGLGAMMAFELVKDPKTREPDAALTAAILSRAEERGLILLSCGTSANVVRLLAPLTIPEAVLEEGLGILSAAVKDAAGLGAAGSGSARAVA